MILEREEIQVDLPWIEDPRWMEPPNRMLVYISGPMTGRENFNAPAFENARIIAEAMSYDVIVPGDGEEHTKWELTHQRVTDEHMQEYIRRDITDILKVDELWVLEGWKGSFGSRLEVLVAKSIGVPVYHLDGTEVFSTVGTSA